MNVLFVCNSTSRGGGEMYIETLARGLRRRGHGVVVSAPDGSLLAEYARSEPGVTFLPCRLGPSLGRSSAGDFALRWSQYSAFLVDLFGQARDHHGVDLVHLLHRKEQILGTRAARAAGLPVVWTVFGYLPDGFVANLPALWLYRRAARRASRILCVSQAIRDHLIHHDLPESSLEVVSSSVQEVAPADPAARKRIRRDEWGVIDGQPVVGTVGRLVAAKGVDVFLRAASRIRESLPHVQFVVVGDGPERGALEAEAMRLGLEGSVRFLGYREDVSDILAGLDVYISASRLEGWGTAIAEAALAGVPIVATDVGGCGEIVENGTTGYLVPSEDEMALATETSRLLLDPALRAELGRAARRKIESAFGLDASVGATERAFLSVLP